MKETTFIYCLIDPITNEPRYIGKANNPKERFKNHLNKARDKNTHKRNWINSLKKKSLKPRLEIIKEVPISEWHKYEKYYIAEYKKLGYNLVNYTNGGDGATLQNNGSFKKGQISLNIKQVVALNKDGTFFREFASILQACNFLNVKTISLFNIFSKKKRFFSHNYLWLEKNYYYSLSNNDILEILNKIKEIKETSLSKNTQFKPKNKTWNTGLKGTYTRDGKQVYQYSLDKKELLNIFNSVIDAAKFLNKKDANISACARGINKTAYGYYWSYKKIEE